MILVILVNALFAASVTINKLALAYTTPLFLIGTRMTIGGLILLTYSRKRTGVSTTIKKHHRSILAQVIIFGFLLTYAPRTWALQYLPAYKTFFLNNISPFCAALFGYFLFREKLTRNKWLGLLIGFIGMIPILLTTSIGEQRLGELLFLSWPELAVLFATAMQTYGKTRTRQLVHQEHYAPTFINGITMTTGGFITLCAAFIFDGFFPVTNAWNFIPLIGLLIIVSNLLAHTLLTTLMKRYTLTFLSLASFLGPVFAALYAWLFFAEQITWHFFASSIIVLTGLLIFYSEELQTQSITKH